MDSFEYHNGIVPAVKLNDPCLNILFGRICSLAKSNRHIAYDNYPIRSRLKYSSKLILIRDTTCTESS